MAQWLKQALAQDLGVVANIVFPLPSSFIWQMFHQVLPEVPKENPYTKPAMLWRLMQLLPQCMDDELFAPLAGYLAQDDDGRRCYQLCQRIADLFDQYLRTGRTGLSIGNKAVHSARQLSCGNRCWA